jgi:hypothetical protein
MDTLEEKKYKYVKNMLYLLPIMEKETNLKLKPIYSYNRTYFMLYTIFYE